MSDHKLKQFGIGKKYYDATLSKYELPDEDLKIISEWLKRGKGMFTFCGNPGIGKTYLCSAIINDLFKNPLGLLRYYNVNGLLQHLRSSIGDITKGDTVYELNRLCETEWFILDDLGSNLVSSDWQKEMIFNFVNTRYESELPTIITTNLNAEQIAKDYTPRLLSRLKDKSNLFMELWGPDKRLLS